METHKGRLGIFVMFACLCAGGTAVFPQSNDRGAPPEIQNAETGVIPPILLRPGRGEALRYPQDMIIGELGRGQAPEDAYVFARSLMVALFYENRNSRILSPLSSDFWDGFFENLRQVRPRKYHLGGGREEPDGSVSFLFRFIGSERGAAGELYVRKENNLWLLEEIILEPLRDIGSGKEPYKYDFSPYERFF
ncbi:MAG: hypothetical protein LBL19_07290 [Spirochaetaceae bacterium]|jgi:hypothetical protein|nr:hypothetical protein [Spirochaetaceae bacterium]